MQMQMLLDSVELGGAIVVLYVLQGGYEVLLFNI